jgi:hypothetical protein
MFMSLNVLEITLLIEMILFALWRFRQDLDRHETSRNSDDSHPWLPCRSSRLRTPQFPPHWKVPMPVL